MIFHQPSNSQYNYSYNATVYQNISWQPHFHRNFEVICVLSGAVDCMVNGKRGVLKAGEFGMCLSNEVHEYRSVGASVSWVGVFSGDFVHAFEKQTKNKTGSDFRFVCPDECFRYLSAALLHPERPDLLTLKSCLYALCAAYGSQVPLVERTEKDDSPMRQIVDFIAENYRSRITLADLAGKRVAVQLGTSGEALLADEEGQAALAATFEGGAPLTMENFNICGTELAAGSVDAVVIDLPVAQTLAKKFGGMTILEETLGSEQYGICFRSGDEALCKQVEDGIMKLVEDGTYLALAEKYELDPNVLCLLPQE